MAVGEGFTALSFQIDSLTLPLHPTWSPFKGNAGWTELKASFFPSEDESDPAGTSRALGCLNKAPNPPAVAHIHFASFPPILPSFPAKGLLAFTVLAYCRKSGLKWRLVAWFRAHSCLFLEGSASFPAWSMMFPDFIFNSKVLRTWLLSFRPASFAFCIFASKCISTLLLWACWVIWPLK